ncbi:MAG: c-type cytochrome [Burkholderiales bacterium]
MAGGLAIPTPVGTIVSTNITPSRAHGIGSYSLADFAAALREGRRTDGAHLYPAMPYTAYALVSDDDVAALYAYFMLGVQPVEQAAPATSLPFPFNMRWLMAGWNLLFLPRGAYAADSAHDAQWNRGAYLARGLAHCGSCHTPRNALMAERGKEEFAGGAVGAWRAPNITSDAVSGIGGWGDAELLAYLRDGHAAGKSQAAGPMAEAVDNSLRHLAAADLEAIVRYLKSVPAQRDPAQARPAYAWGAVGDDLPAVRGVAWPADRAQLSGPQLYDAHCATCHQASAQGTFDARMPPLFHNAALGRVSADNLVLVILDGLHRQSDVFMPGFRATLSDQQLATLATYLRTRWGNSDGAAVSAQSVADLRSPRRHGGGLLWLARAGIAAGVFVVLALAFLLVRHRRRRRRT